MPKGELNARMQALSSLPEDWEVMRQRAHGIRLHTINNLDEYLDQFIDHASEQWDNPASGPMMPARRSKLCWK